MKNFSYTALLFTLFMLFACESKIDENAEIWKTGPIDQFTVTPINGGATITYTIPNDPGILYIMAEYERNGRIYTEKSSVHKNSLTIEGFHGVDKVKASLYKVNRQEQKSEPVVVEFQPLESLISIAEKSLKMRPDFGGIVAAWDNPQATELGVRLMVRDSLNSEKLMTSEMYFSTKQSEVHAFRGFESVENRFAISFEDKWGNVSDTMSIVTTPFFESMLEKPWVDLRATIPYDNTTQYGKQAITMLWDGVVNTGYNGYRSNPGSSGISFTFDLKRIVKISRIVQHSYHVNTPYGHSNINEVEVWGTDKLDYDKLTDLPYWLDETSVREGRIHSVNPETVLPERTFKDDWVYLGWHSQPRYDLMVPRDTQAERNLAANGFEWEIPSDAKPVRYIRVYVRGAAMVSPPHLDNQYSIGELTVYGDPNVPQE